MDPSPAPPVVDDVGWLVVGVPPPAVPPVPAPPVAAPPVPPVAAAPPVLEAAPVGLVLEEAVPGVVEVGEAGVVDVLAFEEGEGVAEPSAGTVKAGAPLVFVVPEPPPLPQPPIPAASTTTVAAMAIGPARRVVAARC